MFKKKSNEERPPGLPQPIKKDSRINTVLLPLLVIVVLVLIIWPINLFSNETEKAADTDSLKAPVEITQINEDLAEPARDTLSTDEATAFLVAVENLNCKAPTFDCFDTAKSIWWNLRRCTFEGKNQYLKKRVDSLIEIIMVRNRNFVRCQSGFRKVFAERQKSKNKLSLFVKKLALEAAIKSGKKTGLSSEELVHYMDFSDHETYDLWGYRFYWKDQSKSEARKDSAKVLLRKGFEDLPGLLEDAFPKPKNSRELAGVSQ